MRYFALATDYDGTLANDGAVHPDTLATLGRLKESGRRLILVTGRLMSDLTSVFPGFGIFEQIVAENGAILYDTRTKTETVLGEPPPPEFAEALADRGVGPLEIGRVMVAARDVYKQTILQTIEELGLELQIIFNKGAAMVLPSGVNKATGLNAALRRLGLSAHNTVGVGDAENDHAFLNICERSIAVANALPALRAKADLVTARANGAGVSELIEHLLENDLTDVPARNQRDTILLGEIDHQMLRIPAYGATILVPQARNGENLRLIGGIMERLADAGYQFLAIDPGGKHDVPEGAVVVGDKKRAPTPDEVVKALAASRPSIVVNLLGVPMQKRQIFFEALLPRVREMRVRTGRPHWVIIDGAYQLLPVMQRALEDGPVKGPTGAILLTMDPVQIPEGVLCSIDTIIAMGDQREQAVQHFCTSCDGKSPSLPDVRPEPGTALLWSRKKGGEPLALRLRLPE